MADPVWFWQRMVSPHMAGLAAALAAEGRDVTYVAERVMSDDRAMMGWRQPSLGGARLLLAPDKQSMAALVTQASPSSVHICQGLRGNGSIGFAGRALARRGLRRWIIMETVEDSGWRGLLRRLEYRRLVFRHRRGIEGILAIGHATADWLTARGMPRERVFPFTYFLAAPAGDIPARTETTPFRILYAGSLLARKRVDLLIDAVASLGDIPVELEIAGNGPLESDLRRRAASLGTRVRWLGGREMAEIPALMAAADCLVLPSRYDGWGAVVSEALMVGTPAICSERCGAAGAVRASGSGGVFRSGDAEDLGRLLRREIAKGRQTPSRRAALADWAACLGGPAGARYLDAILRHARIRDEERPRPPWETVGSAGGSQWEY